jgi:magnesium chelatase subunit D
VLGSLDFERALKDGRKAFQPGLLASAHRGILYIDEVNLLPDHLVDVLLDAAAMGINRVQREGLSIQHPARIALVGTMNQEEGELRPQLLDRFGMMVEVRAPQEPRLRAEIVRRRLAWEADPEGFGRAWSEQQVALREQVVRAQALLPKVTIADGLLLLISELCCSQGVTSLRADLVMNKAARALAALNGRTSVEADDLSRAAMLVLPHRRRAKPFEQPGVDENELERLMRSAADRADGGRGLRGAMAAQAGTLRAIPVTIAVAAAILGPAMASRWSMFSRLAGRLGHLALSCGRVLSREALWGGAVLRRSRGAGARCVPFQMSGLLISL